MTTTVCRIYGYLPAIALAIPVIPFFTLYREGLASEDYRHNRMMMDLCHVVTITKADQSRYEQMTDHFRNRLCAPGGTEPIQEEKPKAYEAGSEEAKNALRQFFGGLNG